ncbi:MAG: ester cyclase [Ignavibacteria bacterium]|nr:ester cyclase [Ignavibacteria bacterium]
MATPNANKTLARRYFLELLNAVNEKSAYELLSDDFIFTLPTHPEPFHGPEGFIGLAKMLHGSFPDFYIFPADMVAGDDWVITRWRGGGTHTGTPLVTIKGDIPANGQSFEIDGMTWHTIKNGKIVESIGHEDTLGLLFQLGVIPSPPAAPPVTTSEQNIALALRYFSEIMSQGKLEVVEEILDPSFAFIIPTQPAPIVGYEAFKGFVMYLRNAFPDIQFTSLRHTCEGDKVASRWTIAGTHQGEFLGMPATGHSIKDFGIDIFTIRNGKIVSVHVNENDFGLMQQLGMMG